MPQIEHTDNEPKEGIFSIDNLWIFWAILSVFCFYFFAVGFHTFFSGMLYLFMTPVAYIAARLLLALLFGFYAIRLKYKMVYKVSFNMRILFYLLVVLSALTCFEVNIETWSVTYELIPAIIYFVVLPLSIKTIKELNLEQSQSVWKHLFQVQLIRKQWKRFILHIVGFILAYISLRLFIDCIISFYGW